MLLYHVCSQIFLKQKALFINVVCAVVYI